MVYWKKNTFHKDEQFKQYEVTCTKTYEQFYEDVVQEVKKLRGKTWSDSVITIQMTFWGYVIKDYYKYLTTKKVSNLPSDKRYDYIVREVGSLVADMAV